MPTQSVQLAKSAANERFVRDRGFANRGRADTQVYVPHDHNMSSSSSLFSIMQIQIDIYFSEGEKAIAEGVRSRHASFSGVGGHGGYGNSVRMATGGAVGRCR